MVAGPDKAGKKIGGPASVREQQKQSGTHTFAPGDPSVAAAAITAEVSCAVPGVSQTASATSTASTATNARARTLVVRRTRRDSSRIGRLYTG